MRDNPHNCQLMVVGLWFSFTSKKQLICRWSARLGEYIILSSSGHKMGITERRWSYFECRVGIFWGHHTVLFLNPISKLMPSVADMGGCLTNISKLFHKWLNFSHEKWLTLVFSNLDNALPFGKSPYIDMHLILLWTRRHWEILLVIFWKMFLSTIRRKS